MKVNIAIFYRWKFWTDNRILERLLILLIIDCCLFPYLSTIALEKCAFPGIPFNGELTINTTMERIIYFDIPHNNSLTYPSGTVVDYQCSLDGFQLNGPTRRQCQQNGTWSLVEPLCDENVAYRKRVNCSYPECDVFTDGHLSGNAIDCPILHGHPVNFLEVNLEMSYSIQNVVIFGDDLIQNINNDTVTIDGRDCLREDGNSCVNCITYHCNEHNSSGITGKSIRFQYVSTGHFPICEIQVYSHSDLSHCGLPEYPMNGFITLKNNTFNQTVVAYSCSEGFILQGSPERICVAGQWKDRPPICIPISSEMEERNGKQRQRPGSGENNADNVTLPFISVNDPAISFNEQSDTPKSIQNDSLPVTLSWNPLLLTNVTELVTKRTGMDRNSTEITEMINDTRPSYIDTKGHVTTILLEMKELTDGITPSGSTTVKSDVIPLLERTTISVADTELSGNVTKVTVTKDINSTNRSSSAIETRESSGEMVSSGQITEEADVNGAIPEFNMTTIHVTDLKSIKNVTGASVMESVTAIQRSVSKMVAPSGTTIERSDADRIPNLSITRNDLLTSFFSTVSGLFLYLNYTATSSKELSSVVEPNWSIGRIITTPLQIQESGTELVTETSNVKQSENQVIRLEFTQAEIITHLINTPKTTSSFLEPTKSSEFDYVTVENAAHSQRLRSSLSYVTSDSLYIEATSTAAFSASVQWNSTNLTANRKPVMAAGSIFIAVFTLSLVVLSSSTFIYCLWKKRLICRRSVEPYYELLQL